MLPRKTAVKRHVIFPHHRTNATTQAGLSESRKLRFFT